MKASRRRRNAGLIALALGLVALAGGLALRLARPAAPPAPASVPDVALAPAATTAAAALPRAQVHPVRRAAPSPAAASEAAPQAEAPGLPELSDEPVDGPSGIALFPPPGTDPLKQGIVVPEDFELPEGYVRHYQNSDDGRELAPILMFHPDYEWVDEDGVAQPLPENLVVPPELAPAGMPIRMLDLPESEPGGAP